MTSSNTIFYRHFFFVAAISFLFWAVSLTSAGANELDLAISDFKAKGGIVNKNTLSTLRKNNDIIQKLAESGKIKDDVFQKLQKDFAKFNKGVADRAAEAAGCNNKSQLSDGKATPATDSDFILENANPDKPMSYEKIKKARTRYNELMNEELGTTKIDYAKKLDTDLMANPKGMTDAEFKKVAKLNNDAYTRPGAATAEDKMRIHKEELKNYRKSGGKGKKPKLQLTPEEIGAYQDEMNDFVKKKKLKINKLNKMRGAKNLSSKQLDDIASELKIAQQRQAKYRSRLKSITAIEESTISGKTASVKSEPSVTEKAADRSVKKQGMSAENSVKSNKNKSIASSNLNDHLTAQANSDAALNKAKGAIQSKGPARKSFIDKAAKIASQLPPDQQGQFIDKIKKLGDPELAKQVTTQLRKNNSRFNKTVRRSAKLASQLSPADQKKFVAKVESKYGAKAAKKLTAELHTIEYNGTKNRIIRGSQGAKEIAGKAMKVMGTAIMVTSGLSLGQDIVDVINGDMPVEQLLDKVVAISSFGVVPLAVAVAEEREQSIGDWEETKNILERAQRTEDEGRCIQIAKKLLEYGVDKKEIEQIIDAVLEGDEKGLYKKQRELHKKNITFTVPPKRIVIPPGDIGPVVERLISTAETAGNIVVKLPAGLWHELKRAGKFVFIGAPGLIRKAQEMTNEDWVGIAGEAADTLDALGAQQKQHITDLKEKIIWERYADSLKDELEKAELTHQDHGIYIRLRRLGASPKEAKKVIKLIRGEVKNDKKLARDLIKKIQSRQQAEQVEANKQAILSENNAAAKNQSRTSEKDSSKDNVLVTVEKDTKAPFEKLAKEVGSNNKKENVKSSIPSDDTTADHAGIKDTTKEKSVKQTQKSASLNPPGCFQNSDDTINDEFGKLVKQAAEKQRKKNGPVLVDVENGKTDAENELDSAKRPVELDESPTPSGHLSKNGLSIVAEPDIPPGPGSSIEPTTPASGDSRPDTPKTPETIEKATSLHLRLVTQPAKSVLQLGETVKILACVDNSPSDLLFTVPLEYTWHGHDSADGGVALVTSDEPGVKIISVSVTGKGKRGTSAKAMLSLKFGTVDVIVTEYPRGPVTMGENVPLNAKVQIENKKGENISYLYQWQPHPKVKFNPFETTEGGTFASFDTPGTYKVWVDLYQKSSSGMKKIAESKQVEITVQGLDITLSSNPASPMVGEEVTVKAAIKQKIDPKLMRFVWESKGNIKKGSPSADGQSYSFIAVDTQPVSISLRALAKEDDLQELANESATVTAQKYEVSVSQPKRRGPPPRIWDPKKREIVDQPQWVAVFQHADVQSTLSPKPPGKVNYHWSASPDGCTVSAPYSANTGLNAHKKNSYQLLVQVTDKNNIVLGKGTGTFTVSISQRDLDVAKEKASDQKKAKELLKNGRALWEQGKLQEAISQVVKAQKIVGKDVEISKVLQGMQKQKQQFDDKLQQAVDLIQLDTFKDAEKVLSAAATINDKYIKYKQTLQQLADAKSKWMTQLLKKVENLWNGGHLEEAISVLKNGSEQVSNHKKITNPLKILIKQKEHIDAKLKQVVDLIANEKLDEAEKVLVGAASISEEYEQYKNILQQLNNAQKAAEAKEKEEKLAKQLLEKAKSFWEDGQLKETIAVLQVGSKQFANNKKIAQTLKITLKQKENIDAKLQKADSLIQQTKFEEAEKNLSAAASINDKYSKYIQTLQQLVDARKEDAAKEKLKDKAAALLQQAKKMWNQKEWSAAISLAKNSITIHPDNRGAVQLLQKWQQEHAVFKQKRAGFVTEGNVAEQQKDLVQAISSFQQALQIRHAQTLADHIEQLKKQQQDQNRAEKKFNSLLQKSKSAASNKDFILALTMIGEVLLIKPEHAEALKLQNSWQQQLHDKEQKNTFDKLIAKGYRHEQNSELALAIQSYSGALQIRSDKKITDHIEELRKLFLKREQDRREESRKAEQRDTFDKLIAKGYRHEQNNELSAAIQSYSEALQIWSDQKVADHIEELRKRLLSKNRGRVEESEQAELEARKIRHDKVKKDTSLCVRIVCTSNISTYNKWAK